MGTSGVPGEPWGTHGDGRGSPPTLQTDIWLVVRVPVLSEQMTEVQPRVSTEGRLLTMAFFLAMRRVPSARQVVMTAGSPAERWSLSPTVDQGQETGPRGTEGGHHEPFLEPTRGSRNPSEIKRGGRESTRDQGWPSGTHVRSWMDTITPHVTTGGHPKPIRDHEWPPQAHT